MLTCLCTWAYSDFVREKMSAIHALKLQTLSVKLILEGREETDNDINTNENYIRVHVSLRHKAFNYIRNAMGTGENRKLGMWMNFFIQAELSLWKHGKWFAFTLCRKTKNATINGRFGFVFEEKIPWLLCCHRFRKATFLKCYPSTPKRKANVSKFLLYVERFRKVPFSWRISVDRWPNKKYSYVSKFPRPWYCELAIDLCWNSEEGCKMF